MILVRHGEIFTKSEPVRRLFLKQLVSNIKSALPEADVAEKRWRVFICLEEEDSAVKVLQRVFGIVSIAKAFEVKAEIELIKEKAFESVPEGIASFGVRTQRISKEFPLNSQEISGEVGAFIKKKTGLKVDLTNPDFWVSIEVYGESAFVITEEFKGPGGLPVGSAGGMVECKYEKENDFIAALLMLKRGACVSAHEKLKHWSYGNSQQSVFAVVSGTADVNEFIKLQKKNELPVFSPLIGMSVSEVERLKKLLKQE